MLNKDALTLEFWVGAEQIAKHSIKIGHAVEYDSKFNAVSIKCHDAFKKYSLQKAKVTMPLHLIPNKTGKPQHLYPAKIIKIEDEKNVTIKKDGGFCSYSVNKVIIQLDTEPIMNDADDDEKEKEANTNLPHRFFVYGTMRDTDDSGKEWTALFVAGAKASNAKLYGYTMYQNNSADSPFTFAVRTDNKNDCIVGRVLTFDGNYTFNKKLFDADQFYGYKQSTKSIVNRTIVDVDIDADNSKLKAIMYHQHDDCKIQEMHVDKVLVLLICISSYDKPYDNLKGAIIDKTNMINLWEKQYGYDVIPNQKDRVEEDDYNDLLNECRNILSQKQNKNKYSALIVIFSGHGNEERLILSDGAKMSRCKLWKYFNGENVPFMSNKPKIFVMDSCRGINLPIPVPNNNKKAKVSKGDSDDEHNPDEQIILLYSTTKGYAIPDDDEKGGNVIRTIYDVFSYVDNKHLDDLFKIIQTKVKKLCSAYQCIEQRNLGCDSHIFLERKQKK